MRLSSLRRSVAYETYWQFVIRRQAIFFRRLQGAAPPWTDDQILATHRFTNVYRASDRVSQFLIKEVIYKGSQEPDEVFFRTILFKLFNKIETWQELANVLGPLTWSERLLSNIARVLDRLYAGGRRIYSGAYIMPTFPGSSGRKHRGHLALLKRMMLDRLARQLAKANNMSAALGQLREYPMLGPFLSYQFLIDLNYSNILAFSEMDMVVPGPGALRGVAKCFPTSDPSQAEAIIRGIAEVQEEELRARNAGAVQLFGRPMQLIDCQNVFCEVDKYARLAHPHLMSKDGRMRIKQRYRPESRPLSLWFPPKWGLNERVAKESYASV